MSSASRAGRNRTLTLSAAECAELEKSLLVPESELSAAEAENRLILGDVMRVAPLLPKRFADLLILDPPYNLAKEFNGRRFPGSATTPTAPIWNRGWNC